MSCEKSEELVLKLSTWGKGGLTCSTVEDGVGNVKCRYVVRSHAACWRAPAHIQQRVCGRQRGWKIKKQRESERERDRERAREKRKILRRNSWQNGDVVVSISSQEPHSFFDLFCLTLVEIRVDAPVGCCRGFRSNGQDPPVC